MVGKGAIHRVLHHDEETRLADRMTSRISSWIVRRPEAVADLVRHCTERDAVGHALPVGRARGDGRYVETVNGVLVDEPHGQLADTTHRTFWVVIRHETATGKLEH